MDQSIAMYSSLNDSDVLCEDNPQPKTKHPRLSFRSLLNPFRSIYRATIDDIKSLNWRGLPSVLYHDVLPVLTILGLMMTMVIMATRRHLSFPRTICRPDGTVSDGNSTYNPWKPSETFTINLSFGQLKLVPFGTAKLVDAISDIIIGRGGQGLLAYISYRVTARTLTRLMEKRPVSYGTFEAVTLQQNSVTAFAKLIRDFSRNEGTRTKMTVIWLLFSAASLLIYPTLASAMTGYSANINAQIPLSNHSRVLATSFQNVYYVIHDASRIGLYDNYAVVDHSDGDPSLSVEDECYVYESAGLDMCRDYIMSDCAKYSPGNFDTKSNSTVLSWNIDINERSDCALLWDVSQYVYQYGFGGMNETASTFNNSVTGELMSLSSPSLNVSTFSYADMYMGNNFTEVYKTTPNAWALLPFGVGHGLSQSYDTTANLAFNLSELWAFKGTAKEYTLDSSGGYDDILNFTTIIATVSCQQQAQDSLSQSPIQYRWGFSYQLLISCITLVLTWSIGTYAMHMDAYMNSKPVLQQREMGLRRAILDIAPQYDKILAGKDIKLDSDEDLKKHIGKDNKVSYDALFVVDDGLTRRERLSAWWAAFDLKEWAKHEWLWLSLFVAMTVMYLLGLPALTPQPWPVSMIFAYILNPYLGWMPWLAVLVFLIMGRRHASRWLVLVLLVISYIFVYISLF